MFQDLVEILPKEFPGGCYGSKGNLEEVELNIQQAQMGMVVRYSHAFGHAV